MRVGTLALVAALVVGCSPAAPPEQEVVLLPYPEDGGSVSWDGWAGTFVLDYCVECHQPSAPCGGSGCHQPGDPALFDFHQQSAVVQRAPVIQCGISVQQDPTWDCGTTPPKAFPILGMGNPLPTDEQRGIMVDWLDAGCP